MKQALIDSALEICKVKGLLNLTREDVCTHAGVPDGSFQYHTGVTFDEFRREVAKLNDAPHPEGVGIETRQTCPVLLRAHLVGAFKRIAEVKGVENVTKRDVADFAGTTVWVLLHNFGTVENLRIEALKC